MEQERNLRQRQEQREHEILSAHAGFADETRGRDRLEEQCDIRTDYQRDRDRILHSKAFRRLKQKTQVFLAPEGDHSRTRMTHTLEVAQNARTIARALQLNEDLTEAIALGHDLGQTPYGHAGERALNRITMDMGGFRQNEQSVRVVERLEKDGMGLNLTWEVVDGIENHKTSGNPHTLEGQIVRLSDKIAYVNHDIDDAIRGGILRIEDIPKCYTDILGMTTRERLNTMVHDVIISSMDRDKIVMSPEIQDAMSGLREFLFERVYTNQDAKGEEGKAIHMITSLYQYYMEHLEAMPEEFLTILEERGEPEEMIVCDYIAGMTDN